MRRRQPCDGEHLVRARGRGAKSSTKAWSAGRSPFAFDALDYHAQRGSSAAAARKELHCPRGARL
jgi:hypothetical protein